MKLTTPFQPWFWKHLKKQAIRHVGFFYSDLTGREYFDVEIEGVTCKLGYITFFQHSVARAVSLHKDEFDFLQKWVKYAKGKKRIYDIGAFSGVYGILAAKLNPDAEVIIFEPDPINFLLAERNVALNKLTNCTVEQIAISDFNGESVWDSTKQSGASIQDGSSSDFKADPSTRIFGTTTVQTKELDSYPPADLIKLDIEGQETKTLLKSSLTGKPTIFLELHSWAERKDQMWTKLTSLAYKIEFHTTETQGEHFILT